MSRRSMEFAGVMALVILAVANIGVVGQVLAGTGNAIKRLAHGWHSLVVNDHLEDAAGTNDAEAYADDYTADVSDHVLTFRYAGVSEGDLEMRKAALYALAESTTDRTRLATLLESVALDRLQPELARAAVHLLVESAPDAAAVEALGRILQQSVHASVRRASVYALGEVAASATPEVSSAAIALLTMCVRSDDSLPVRKAAVHTLAEADAIDADAVLFDLVATLTKQGS